MIKKLGIDLGNSNIKYAANTEETKEVIKGTIPSAISVRSGSDNFTNVKGKGATVECNGRSIYLGQGTPLVSIDKTKREYLEHQILYCVFDAFGGGAHTIQIATGLPIKPFKIQKQEYERRLSDILKIDGKVNGTPISVSITKSTVCAEGHASLVSLEDKVSKTVPTLIVDIGYKTSDTLLTRWDEEQGLFLIEKYEGIDIALYDIYKMISERLYGLGGDYTPEEINKRLHSDNSVIRLRNGKSFDLKANLGLANEVYESIVRSLENNYGPLYQYDLLFTGGGSEVFLNGVPTERLGTTVINTTTDEKYYSNAVGYLTQIED